MILQCKITKVVERPGVHYRGRHSPGIFVRWVLPAGSWFSSTLTAVFCAISRFTERNLSDFCFRLNCSILELALDFLFFQERKFHVHIHALPMLIFSSSVIFRRNSLAFAWCYQKMHYFCLAAKNDFLSLHLHFWLLFSDFPWTFPTFLQTTLLLFLIDFWFAEPFRRVIC